MNIFRSQEEDEGEGKEDVWSPWLYNWVCMMKHSVCSLSSACEKGLCECSHTCDERHHVMIIMSSSGAPADTGCKVLPLRVQCGEWTRNTGAVLWRMRQCLCNKVNKWIRWETLSDQDRTALKNCYNAAIQCHPEEDRFSFESWLKCLLFKKMTR